MSLLEELQSLEEPTKTRVLVIATIVIMAIVIYFWMGYFNNIVMNSAQTLAANEQNTTTTPSEQQQPGFLDRVGGGMANIGNAFENFFKSPSKYIVKPN